MKKESDMTEIRQRAIQGLAKGDRFRVTRTFDNASVDAFADISKDYNPVHFSDRFARVRGFNGTVCHGLLVGSMLTEIGGQIGWLATEMGFRFKKGVNFGETVSCTLEITEIRDNGYSEATAIFENAAGEIVIEGRLTGYLPTESQREIMGEMAES